MTITKLDAHKDGCSKGICTAVASPMSGSSFDSIHNTPQGVPLHDNVSLLMEDIDKQISSEHHTEDLTSFGAESTESNTDYICFDNDRGTPLLDEVMDIPFDDDLTEPPPVLPAPFCYKKLEAPPQGSVGALLADDISDSDLCSNKDKSDNDGKDTVGNSHRASQKNTLKDLTQGLVSEISKNDDIRKISEKSHFPRIKLVEKYQKASSASFKNA